MSSFPKTRAAAEYAARHSRAELARAHAAVLLRQLSACEAALADGEVSLPVLAAGPLRTLVQAVRDLTGPAWLAASGDDPDVAAFTVLEATASPPDPARIDEICSRVLWARFGPPGTARDDIGRDGTGLRQASQAADGGNTGTADSTRLTHRRMLAVAHPGQASRPAGTRQEEDGDAARRVHRPGAKPGPAVQPR